MLGAEFAEVLQKSGVAHGGIHAAWVADVLGGKLDDGAGLDVAFRPDVVGDAGAHRAEGFAVASVVGVHDADGHLRPHLDDEAADLDELLGSERELGVHLRPDGAEGVKPDVVRAKFDQLSQPLLGAKVADIGLAHARRDSGEELLF